jgi:hypothetical protein
LSKKTKEPQVIIPLSEYERLKGGSSELREAFRKVLRVLQVDPDLDASDLTVTLARLRDDAERWRSFCTGITDQTLTQVNADTKLGGLVRQMPVRSELQHQPCGWYCYLNKKDLRRNYLLPEEALADALAGK